MVEAIKIKKRYLAWFFVIVIAIAAIWAFSHYNGSSDSLKSTGSVNPSQESPQVAATVYKGHNELSGYSYCSFVFRPEDENYVKSIEYQIKPLCNITNYPIIKDFLYDHYNVTLVESDQYQFVAWYTGNGNIEINKHYSQAKNLDTTLAHEIAHSSTETLNLPDWLSEGIAEYSAHRYFGTQYKLQGGSYGDILHWDANSASLGDNTAAYPHSAYIVKTLVDKYGDNFLRGLIISLDGKISYGDQIDTKNQKILDAIREVTGNESLSYQDILP